MSDEELGLLSFILHHHRMGARIQVDQAGVFAFAGAQPWGQPYQVALHQPTPSAPIMQQQQPPPINAAPTAAAASDAPAAALAVAVAVAVAGNNNNNNNVCPPSSTYS